MSPDDGEADSFVGQTPPMQSPEGPLPKSSQTSSSTSTLGGLFSMFQSTPNTSAADPFSQVKQPDPNQTPSRAPPSIGGPLAALSGPSFSQWKSSSGSQSGSSTPERRGSAPQGLGMYGTPTVGTPQSPAGTVGYSSGPPMTSSFSAPSTNVGQFGAPSSSVGQIGGPPPTSMGQFGGPPVGPPPAASSTPNFHRIQGPPRYAQPPPGTYASTTSQSQLPPLSQPPFSSSMSSTGNLPVAEVTPMVSTPGSVNDAVLLNPLQPGGAMIGSQKLYVPVQPHWYFCKVVEHRAIWFPMSLLDSVKLEDAFRKGGEFSTPVVMATDGGRYDVNIGERQRCAVYWDEAPTEVRRCTWFYKSEGDNRFIPYDEEFAGKLEEEYKVALLSNVWHKRLEFPGGETIVMHNPNVIVHFRPSSLPDEWGTTQDGQMRPRVVKRGIEDTDTIDDGEPTKVDHVVFVCHGIGSICDLRLRSLVECVDNLRSNSLMLLRSHFKRPLDDGHIGRVEYLPVHWHAPLHGDATGVDRNLKRITLKSIPKLRHYTNDTLMDILFYTSPKYCQMIVDTVGGEMNRLYKLFLERTPDFKGKVSVAGHSLGSAILFDLLCHQTNAKEFVEEQPSEPVLPDTLTLESDEIPESVPESGDAEPAEEEVLTIEALLEKLGLMNFLDTFKNEQIDLETLEMCGEADIKELGLPMGPRKKIQGFVRDHKAKKAQKSKEAEVKAQQEAARRVAEETKKKLQEEQVELEKVNGADVHVRDPLIREASRSSMNFLMGKAGTGQPFVTYPQIDFEPANFFALGSPIALFLSTRGLTDIGEDFKLPSATGVFNIFHPFDPVAYRIEPLIQADFCNIKPVLIPHHKGRKRLHLELKESLARVGADLKQKLIDSVKYTWNSINDFARAHRSTAQEVESEIDEVVQEVAATNVDSDKSDLGSTTESVNTEEDLQIGQLNYGRRIDYVLQEKPIESFNDYLFALASHGCYWESEDTALMILKETYALLGVFPELKGPQSTPQKMASPPMYAPPHGPYGQQRPLGMVAPQGPYSSGPPPMGMPPMSRPPMSGAPPTSGPPVSGPPPMSGPPPLSGFVRK